MPHGGWMGLLQTVLHLREPLSGDDEPDRCAVLAALRAGSTTLAVPPLGDPLRARWAWADDGLRVDAPSGVQA